MGQMSQDKRHIVSFSGGKDSTAMLLMMIEKGMPIDEIIF
jgi:tRNA(Ile)-lysidine synthase TilS/MesJ